MPLKHASLTANHRPFADVYADAAARLAAIGFPRGDSGATVAFDTTDLYKEVLQVSDWTTWALVDESPVTWQQTAGIPLTTEQIQDIVGAMFPDVATIDWTYDDATGVVNGVVIGAAPTGSAGGVLGGTYPNPSFANDGVTNAVLANMAQATVKGRASGAGTGDPTDLTAAQVYAILKSQMPETLIIAIGDETTAITTGTAKVTFRMPFAMTVSAVRASLTTASSSGNPTFDINDGGTTILSTKLSIDSGEKTSTTAATPAVISDPDLADDAEITIDVDTAGTGAAGGKIYITGVRA